MERRGEAIDLGISRVVAAAGDSTATHAATLLDDVLATAAVQNTDDDVTVLVLRRC